MPQGHSSPQLPSDVKLGVQGIKLRDALDPGITSFKCKI